MYKVIISDLDGTLLNSRHRFSPRTRETLHRLVALGVRLIMATGRHHVDVGGIRTLLGLDVDLITSNGAMVHDREGTVIYRQYLHPELAQEVAEVSVDGAIVRHLYKDDGWFIERDLPEYLNSHPDSGFAYQVANLRELDKEGISKMFFHGTHEDLLVLERHLQAQMGDRVSMAFSSPRYLEVMQRGVNKGHAAQVVLEQIGLSLGDALAFGDGMNDFEMLQGAGHGVLMGNAQQRLCDRLPHLPRTSSCDEDGVAEYLQKIFG